MSIMKVLLVSPVDLASDSGVNKQIFGLARILQSKKIDAHIAGSSSSAHRFGDHVHSFFAPHDGSKKSLATLASQMHSLLQREGFDVVHAYEPFAGPLTSAAMQANNTATVATFFSRALVSTAPTQPNKRRPRWLTRLLVRRTSGVVKNISALIATSRSVQEDVREAFSRDAKIIPVGIDFARFHPERREPQLKTSLLKVLFVGDVDRPERGFDLLLHALQRVAQARPVELAVVGSHTRDGLIHNENLHVRFYGHVSDMRLPELYRRMDLVVAPATSKRVGGSALLEAMACGAAVVASDVGPYHEITAGSGAVLFPAGNEDALVAALNVLAARPEERMLRGEANALAAHTYRWDHLVGDVIQTYESVVTQKAEAPPFLQKAGNTSAAVAGLTPLRAESASEPPRQARFRALS